MGTTVENVVLLSNEHMIYVRALIKQFTKTASDDIYCTGTYSYVKEMIVWVDDQSIKFNWFFNEY